VTADEIRKHIKAVPFRPFTLNVADGREIPVFDRDFIILSPSGRVVEVYQKDDSSDYLDTSLITGVGFVAPVTLTSSAQSNP
jgi:hypothetical protein